MQRKEKKSSANGTFQFRLTASKRVACSHWLFGLLVHDTAYHPPAAVAVSAAFQFANLHKHSHCILVGRFRLSFSPE